MRQGWGLGLRFNFGGVQVYLCMFHDFQAYRCRPDIDCLKPKSICLLHMCVFSKYTIINTYIYTRMYMCIYIYTIDLTLCSSRTTCSKQMHIHHPQGPELKVAGQRPFDVCYMHVEVITRTANGKLPPEIVKAEGVAEVSV